MNKLLLASTALVASTTFALADVDMSGSAEMGIFGGEDSNGDNLDAQFHSDIDLTFSMSGETDAGLTFGAAVDLDTYYEDGFTGGAFDPAEGGADTSIFVSGSLGTLTMGDTDGAFDFALQEAIIGGSIQDDNEHAGYNGNAGLDGYYDGQVARYDYAFGDFSVALSAEIDDDPDDGFDVTDFGSLEAAAKTQLAEIGSDSVLGIGVRYSGEFRGMTFGAGLGYQQADNDTVTLFDDNDNVLDPEASNFDPDDVDDVEIENAGPSVVGASLSLAMDGGIQAIVNYSDYDDFSNGFDNHFGIAVGYEFEPFLVAVNYGKFNLEDDGGEREGYALVVNYDLGGGAELQGSYAHNDVPGDDDDSISYDRYSFGIAMSF